MKIYKIKVNKKQYIVELESIDEVASEKPAEVKPTPEKAATTKAAPSGEGQQVLSPIQGSIVDVRVSVGDKVSKGDVLLIIEAMKLENEVPSAFDGEVAEILVSKGQNVSAKEVLIVIK